MHVILTTVGNLVDLPKKTILIIRTTNPMMERRISVPNPVPKRL